MAAGWYGEEVELRRRITHARNMITRTREKAEVKVGEYQTKINDWQEQLDALTAENK